MQGQGVATFWVLLLMPGWNTVSLLMGEYWVMTASITGRLSHIRAGGAVSGPADRSVRPTLSEQDSEKGKKLA